MEQPGPSFEGSSFNNRGSGAQYNAPGGTQNNNTGSGNQFPEAHIQTLNIHQNSGDDETYTRKSAILQRLRTLDYKERMERNPERISGTCEWFVTHKSFKEWQQSKSSYMLWVSADPGCGKSVLAKHLINSVLPTTDSRTTCYFFFKDDFEDQRSVNGALCCILHQLFKQKNILFSDKILKQFEADRENLTSSFGELWDVLISAAGDENAGEVVCIFDAFDECDDYGRFQLAEALCKLYSTKAKLNLKVLLTTRPYGQIREGFHPLEIPQAPVIHLSGESGVEMEMITREIDIFIKDRVQNIGAKRRLKQDEQDLLLQGLIGVPNRTYLWIHLTLDLIEHDIDIDRVGISHAITHLPQTVNEAYERILSKSHDPGKAKRLLHIIVAAARPLTLKEMNSALAHRASHQSYADLGLDLKPEERFRENVRDLCGLFVTVVDEKIYLLHQTAKEFLVPNDQATTPEGVSRNLKWKHALQPQESHNILAEICIWHLLFSELETHPLRGDKGLSKYAENHVFLDYSAKNWAAHLRNSQIKVDSVMQSVLKICDASSKRCSTWFRIYWTGTQTDFPKKFTSLMIVSYLGLTAAVRHLLKMDGVDVNSKDSTYKRSALSWASENGFDTIVELLIRGGGSVWRKKMPLRFSIGAEVDSVDKYRRTPLSYAAWNGHVAVVKLLLRARARVDLKDEINGTPLSYAICGEHEAVEKLLVGEIKVGSADTIRREMLLSAAEKGHKAVVERLLAGKVDADAKDKDGRTPLWLAVRNGHEAIFQRLLDSGKVDVDAKDEYGRTLLLWAASYGYEAIVQRLLDTGKADVDAKDKDGRTPLSWAAASGHEAIVKLLFEKGAELQ